MWDPPCVTALQGAKEAAAAKAEPLSVSDAAPLAKHISDANICADSSALRQLIWRGQIPTSSTARFVEGNPNVWLAGWVLVPIIYEHPSC